MMTWLTRISYFDTAEDLETGQLMLCIKESHDLLESMLFDVDDDLAGHPVERMWTGYEIALAAYSTALSVEAATRGISDHTHLRVASMVNRLRSDEGWGSNPYVPPPWQEDTDVLRSHRSNMIRRWPGYASLWPKTDELMPYVWPFVDPDDLTQYKLMVSKHDRELLANGERKLPKKIRERVYNL